MKKFFTNLLECLAATAIILFAVILRLVYMSSYIFDVPRQAYLKHSSREPSPPQ